MTTTELNGKNYQGGKVYGALKKEQSETLDEINRELIDDEDFADIEDIAEKLERYKNKFIEFDEDGSGDIDIMELKRMMEKLDQAKTHLELKKMIAEVDKSNSGTISYREFLEMMLGKKNSVLKMILMFEEMRKEKERPKGLPPKRSLDSLP